MNVRCLNTTLLLAFPLGNLRLHRTSFGAGETRVLRLWRGPQVAQLGGAALGHCLLVVYVYVSWQVAMCLLVGSSSLVALGLSRQLFRSTLVLLIFLFVVTLGCHIYLSYVGKMIRGKTYTALNCGGSRYLGPPPSRLHWLGLPI